MKYALALAGGGTRGAFEVGVWRALNELGIEISAIVGTSIGAVNGAIFASGLDGEELWTNIKARDIIDIKGDNLFSIHTLISSAKQLADGGIDASAFTEFLSKHLNEEKVRMSDIEYGLCTYRTDTKESAELFIDDIPEGELADYVLASANFPMFKRKTINGAEYVDGSVTNNLPLNMLINRGYDSIIAVTVKGVGLTKNVDRCGVNIINIDCRTPEVGLMEFDKDSIIKSIKSGYYECMRVFGRYWGDLYSITPDSFSKAVFRYGREIVKGDEEEAAMCGIDRYKAYTFDELASAVVSSYTNSRRLQFLVRAIESSSSARGVLDNLGRFFRAGNAVVYLKKHLKCRKLRFCLKKRQKRLVFYSKILYNKYV